MIIDDIETQIGSPQKNNQQQQIDQKYQTLQQNLEYLLDHYQLESVQEMINIIIDPQLSLEFKQKFPQFSALQASQLKLTQKLKKIAVEHTYEQTYIYYQQFPMYLTECKKVLRHKYRFDDILRTHQNRKSIWLLCSGALFKIKQNPNYYDRLSKTRELSPQFFKSPIEKDVVRTVTDKTNKQQQNSMSNILRNFAIRNPYIGYCQGMNFIVNFLILMQFTEQQAFWILTLLMQQFLPKTYYTNMMGIAVDINIVEQYMRVYYPDLYEKLQQMNLNLNLFTLEWLVCLFTTTLPFYMLVIIWDMMLINGPTVLLKVCVVILDQLQETILNTQDLSQLLVILQTKKKGIFIEEDQFINRISNIYFDDYLLDLCRQMVEIKLMKEKLEMNSQIRKIIKKNLHVHCDVSWPVCFKALKQHKSDMGEIQVWTLKEDGPVKIINDYLLIKNKSAYKTTEYEKSSQKKLLIGRIPHVCNLQEYNKQYQNQNIELEDYDMNRKNLQSNLIEWAFELKQNQNNQHLDFYKRATSSNLAFLQMRSSIRSSGEKNKNGSKGNISPRKKDIKQKNTFNSLILPQIHDDNLSNANNIQDKKKLLSSTFSQQSGVQNASHIRNPFRKLKQKWRERRQQKKREKLNI